VGAEQQKYIVSPGGEAGGILPLEGCRRESRIRRRLEAGVGSLDRSRCPFGGCGASIGYRTAVRWIIFFCGVNS
jgi:hypothetical protein